MLVTLCRLAYTAHSLSVLLLFASTLNSGDKLSGTYQISRSTAMLTLISVYAYDPAENDQNHALLKFSTVTNYAVLQNLVNFGRFKVF